MTKILDKNFVIHFVSGARTACGLLVSQMMVVTCNPRRTTCLRCTSTNAWKRSFAGLKKHENGGRKFIQQRLFAEVK